MNYKKNPQLRRLLGLGEKHPDDSHTHPMDRLKPEPSPPRATGKAKGRPQNQRRGGVAR